MTEPHPQINNPDSTDTTVYCERLQKEALDVAKSLIEKVRESLDRFSGQSQNENTLNESLQSAIAKLDDQLEHDENCSDYELGLLIHKRSFLTRLQSHMINSTNRGDDQLSQSSKPTLTDST